MKPKPKPAATHWLRVEAPPEDIEVEILDRLEEWGKTDIVLRLHGLHHDDMFRISAARCWCSEGAPIEKACDRMAVGLGGFHCFLHNKDITIRRSLDPLMKTKEKRAELLERHPVLQGIRDGLYKTYFCFEAGAHFEKRSIGEHQPTALREVAPVKDKPLRGCVLECINADAAQREFDRGLEDAPWREGLEDLLDRDMTLRPGWHLGPLSQEERFREDMRVRLEQHRNSLRILKQQEAERLSAEVEALAE